MKKPRWLEGLPFLAWELVGFIGTVVIMACIAAMVGCAGHLTAKRALAVGLGATATAFLITSSTCADDDDASCRQAIYRGIAASFAVGVSAGTALYLSETEEPAPYNKVSAVWRPAVMIDGAVR